MSLLGGCLKDNSRQQIKIAKTVSSETNTWANLRLCEKNAVKYDSQK